VHDVRLQGSAGRLQSRNISERTAELFKTYRDGEVLRHYYYDSTGSLVGAKVRTKDKQFRCEGEVKTLFGMQLFKHKTAKEQKLVITEGEMDAMSVYECQPWPVVSLPNGAASAKRAIKNNYEWINHYDKIVLFFDNDEAGQQAAIDAASVLPPGKVFIGVLDEYKDASEALQAKDYEAIRQISNTNQTALSMQRHCLKLLLPHCLQQIMITHFEDYKQSFTGSGTESLSRLLQVQGSENHHSVVTYVLTCSTAENGSVSWHLKSQTVVLLSD
jgi:5S rRNA maturation endonuclease (ribonuclease M5)